LKRFAGEINAAEPIGQLSLIWRSVVIIPPSSDRFPFRV